MYSMQSGTFDICLIGYHVSGSLNVPLAKVTFYLDNGAVVDVTSPNYIKTLSAVSKTVPEYCVQASDSALNDGEHEFRAVAYPIRGYPRVLASNATVTVTSGSADVAHRGHGHAEGSLLTISGSADANLSNGPYCVLRRNLSNDT